MPNAPRRAKPAAAPAQPTAAEPGAVVRPTGDYWLFAFGFAALGAIVGMLFLHYRNPPAFTAAAGISAFAPLYVLAQAIERILEPANHFLRLGGDTESATRTRNAAVAEALATSQPAHVAAASAAQHRLDHLRANRVALCWGLASALAMVGCGYFGIGVLHAIGDNGVPRYMDVIVTGLAVGGGTKPLHDFIASLQSSAQAKKGPAALR
jgi:hypothetical protein